MSANRSCLRALAYQGASACILVVNVNRAIRVKRRPDQLVRRGDSLDEIEERMALLAHVV